MSTPETKKDVVDRAKKSMALAIEALNISPTDKAVVRDIVLSTYPEFCGIMHQLRDADAPADMVRAACEILLTNIVYETVKSLAPRECQPDMLRNILKSVRSGVRTALVAAR